MYDLTDDLEEEKDGKAGQVRRWLWAICGRGISRMLLVLATPFIDCRRRAYPREVPDYSVLVFVTCLANPVLGAVVCCLYKQAQKLFVRGKKRTADYLYIFTIILAHVIIGLTMICLASSVAYVIIAGRARDRPPVCALYRQDFEKMDELNMSKRAYCRKFKFT